MRTTLVSALAACADSSQRPQARRFLSGLSADELQYIAEFLGACILESTSAGESRIASFQGARAGRRRDHDLKSILVLEYLRRAGLNQLTPAGIRVH